MKRIFISFLSLVAIASIWELAALKGFIDIQFYPPPHLFIMKALELMKGEFLFNHFSESMIRFTLASLISIPLALIIGILTGSSVKTDQLINPFLAFTYPLPKVAIFPLLLLIFGLGNSSKIVLIAIGMFYLIYINVRSATQHLVNSALMDIVVIYKINSWNYAYHFLLKGILREFLIGLKAALGYGLLLVVVSEFSASRNGMGYFIWQSWDQFRVVDMYASIFILCLLGLFFSSLLDFLIKRTRSL